MKDFHPAMTDDEVLQEVWRIKDETAKRFRSVADYVRSLHRPSSAFGETGGGDYTAPREQFFKGETVESVLAEIKAQRGKKKLMDSS